MDPRVRHAIFHHMGLRLLNIAYVQPPLAADQEKCNTLLLCVYLSPKIPSYQQGGETVYYLPTATVRYAASPHLRRPGCRRVPTRPRQRVDVRRRRQQLLPVHVEDEHRARSAHARGAGRRRRLQAHTHANVAAKGDSPAGPALGAPVVPDRVERGL